MVSKLQAALVAVLILIATLALADDYVGVVKRASGHVVVERDGISLSPAAGIRLKLGDRVITGPDGHAHVRLNGAAPVSVGPDTNVALDRFVPALQASDEHGLLKRLASYFSLNRHR